MQISDKLIQIAENELKVYNKGKFAAVEDVDPFYGQEQGLTVVASNVTTVDHELGVRLSSKNLFNEAEANITKTDDYFKSNVSYWQRPCLTIPVESGATYTCSCEYYTPNTTTFNTFLAYSISKEKTYTSASKALVMRLKAQHSSEGYSKVTDIFTVPDGIEEVYFLTDNEGSGTFFKNFQIEKGNSATAYAPFVADFSDCKVKVRGKNLVDMNNYEVWNDGSIGFSLDNLIEGQTYAFSTNIPIKQMKVTNAPWGYSCSGGKNIDDGFIENKWVHKRVEQLSSTTPLYLFIIPVGETSFIKDITTFNGYQLQIEAGNKETEYEPYNEASTEYTANADGTVEGVKSFAPTMTLISENNNALINANYIKDIDKVFEETITQIALSGGE